MAAEKFLGEWVDDCAAGKCENFENFVKAIGLTEKEIAGYRDLVASQVTTLDGEKWHYTYDFGGATSDHDFKLNILNPKDKDIEGNEFEMKVTFDKENKYKMIEETKTYRPNGVITTKTERVVNEAGDHQDIVVTHIETGEQMKGSMSKRKTKQ